MSLYLHLPYCTYFRRSLRRACIIVFLCVLFVWIYFRSGVVSVFSLFVSLVLFYFALNVVLCSFCLVQNRRNFYWVLVLLKMAAVWNVVCVYFSMCVPPVSASYVFPTPSPYPALFLLLYVYVCATPCPSPPSLPSPLLLVGRGKFSN